MTVDSSAPAASPGEQGLDATPRATALGSDAFLQLLITKLQNQDPTNPQTDTDFIAQLATFSSLEQLTSINTAVAELSVAIRDLTAAQTPTFGGAASTQKGTA